MSDQAAILATLEDYANAYCAKNLTELMAIFDDGEDISLIGTGADELCTGRAATEAVFTRNFAEATATNFQWQWQHVTVAGDSAVVATTLIIHLEIDSGPIQVPIRWTVSLVRRGERWRWLHRHASAAATSQDEGTAYPTGT